jgi:hypothetical protein
MHTVLWIYIRIDEFIYLMCNEMIAGEMRRCTPEILCTNSQVNFTRNSQIF